MAAYLSSVWRWKWSSYSTLSRNRPTDSKARVVAALIRHYNCVDLGIRTLLFIHPLPGANRVLYGTPVTRNNRCLLQPSAVCTAVRKTRTTYPPRTHITPVSYNAGHVRHKLGPGPSKLLLFLLLFRRCQIMGVLQNIVRMWGL